MCVGCTCGFKDYPPQDYRKAMLAMTPGSCVSFNRIGLFHFAIFLGFGWPKGGSRLEPVPLLCHFSGDTGNVAKASVRLDDLREVVLNSTIRVYKCSCTAKKRATVVSDCLESVGEGGYNILTNNCEHFVRKIINNENFSYQSMWTIIAPIVQVPRLIIGSVVSGSTSSNSSISGFQSLTKFGSFSSFGLIDPQMNLMEISVSDGGLKATVTKNPRCCSREFLGCHSAQQELHQCGTCGIADFEFICKYCAEVCHATPNCRTKRVVEGWPGVCSCKCCYKSSESTALRHYWWIGILAAGAVLLAVLQLALL